MAWALLDIIFEVILLPLWPFIWLMCRMKAARCPKCGSGWRTELVGEWGAEMWSCHGCGNYWETPYPCRHSKN